MFRFEGKTALVTGGARGVGRVISIRLAEAGAHVVVNCFHSYDLAKTMRAELAERGLEIEVVRASVGQRKQVDRMFDELADRYDGLDLLVNNAALGSFGAVLDVGEEQLDKALSVNLKGSLWCAQRAFPLMRRRGGGAIVNLSSVGASMIVGNYVNVGTAKAAVEALTRYLAVEFAPANVRVNTASGGLIEGEVAQLFPAADDMHDVVSRCTPLGGLGRPEDLADVVLFLLSDAARWVTGQTLVADGGLSLGGAMLTPASVWRTRDPADREQLAGPGRAQSSTSVVARPHEDRPGDDCDDRSVVAVVGAGLVVPGANNPDEFWRVLDEGPQLLTDIQPNRFPVEWFYSPDRAEEDKTYQTRSGYAENYVPHQWLAEELGSDRRRTEYTTQWFRHAVWDAVQGVRLPDGSRTSCVVGYTPDSNQHLEEVVVIEGILDDLAEVTANAGWDAGRRDTLLREARAILQSRYPHHRAPVGELLPHQVGRRAIDGVLPSDSELIMVDTACSSAMYAVDIGVKAILEGKHDVAVCGGSCAVGPRNAVLFAKLHGLSASGEVRPLDRRADGVLFSDGAAAVTLKRLDLARRDGDRILGYISAIGTSSDGRGKAIYAPNVVGQRLAIERALAKTPGRVRPDWVVAHATGTPAGDLCEITSIRHVLGAGSPLHVTSNKALVGHTGWAAGVVSLIQVLLSFRNSVILPQHRFTASPDEYALDGSGIRIPEEPVSWSSNGRPRVASVSGFGFGGTNAHMVVQDRPSPQPRPDDDDVVITAWSAHVPGLSEAGAVREWLAGAGPAPELSFGPAYEVAGMRLRMPPRVLRTLDRCQLMVLRCADDLRQALGDLWDAHRATTGVFLGHMGPTRHAVLYGKRCHLDNALEALQALPGTVALDASLREALRVAVRDDVPASNEDSFPGIMPNVISARVSNHFGLNGPNLTVDLGFGSTLGACEVAARYLRAGDVDIALLGGVNGNSTPVVERLARALTGHDELRAAEGAFMFAVTRRSFAESNGLAVLATVGPLGLGDRGGAEAQRMTCGTPAGTLAGPAYLGADSAVAMLRALVQDGNGAPERTVLAYETPDAPPLSLALRLPVRERPALAGRPAAAPQAPQAQPAPELMVRRHVAQWVPTRPDPARAALEALPGDAVVVTATPELLGDIGSRTTDPLVLSLAPASGPRRRQLSELSHAAVLAAIGPDLDQVRHVRVVTDLAALAPSERALDDNPEPFFRLQDAVFLTLQACEASVRDRAGSVLAVFTSAWADGVLHPFAGLFAGLLKSAALEFDGHVVASVFTSQTRLEPALRELERESMCRQLLPVTVYDGGIRHTLAAAPSPADPAAAPPLDHESVVVAVGGGRGITAELVKAVAVRYQPVIYVVGSTPLDELRADLDARGGPEGLGGRAEFIQRELAAIPGRPVRAVNAAFDRLQAAVEIMRNLAVMEQHCGVGRVHYVRADVLEQDQLDRAFGPILTEHGRIDLLVHGAGVNRAAALSTKTLAQFREVRAVKVQGYLNIRRALLGRLPRMWCSFASLIALTGQLGETDYAASNDFLGTAALHNRIHGQDEFAIGWTLWKEVGMASSSVHHSFFTGARANVLTQMSTAEGVHHFLAELTASNRAGATYHLGDTEKAAVESMIPGYFAPRQAPERALAGTSASRGRFHVDNVRREPGGAVVVERQFTAERDGYLRGHLVRGVPTLPGCFVTELAAEAAHELLPDLQVIGFRRITFDHFLRLGGATDRSPRRIRAELVARDEHRAVVRVRVTGDVVSPAGVVLSRDKLHFTADVVLAPDYPAAPRWDPWPDAPETPIIDPYHVDGASVSLTGPFVTTANTRLHPLGKRATYTNPVGEGSVFEQFLVPGLMLDGLLRLAVLELVKDRYIPLAAPTGIRRIDLYAPDNDVDLASRGVPIELSVTPRGLLYQDSTAGSRFVAASPDGRVVLQLKDVTGVALGYVDALTGQHVDARLVEAAAYAPGTTPQDPPEVAMSMPALAEALPL